MGVGVLSGKAETMYYIMGYSDVSTALSKLRRSIQDALLNPQTKGGGVLENSRALYSPGFPPHRSINERL